jgi:hypothetical protein
MSVFGVSSLRLLGCLALAGAVVAASVGYARARSHIVPRSPAPGPVLITGDKSFGESYWLLPGTEIGLIQFSGSPYRARHTGFYLGTCIASVPLTIPWLLTIITLGGFAVVLLFQRSSHDNAAYQFGPANGSQPFSSETNSTSSAVGSRR